MIIKKSVKEKGKDKKKKTWKLKKIFCLRKNEKSYFYFSNIFIFIYIYSYSTYFLLTSQYDVFTVCWRFAFYLI